ncbi:endoglucanase E-4-like [Physella acuta]|uniref:endoglucanase E-4-like n=1 Tax=Physella acuta TaxID=109671 RepID=UPI0027DC9632|nr:endoglucanase E-4-like [Physella acuta]
MLIRPLINPNITIYVPEHSFWPWVPLAAPKNSSQGSDHIQLPAHNFWPWIPVEEPEFKKQNGSKEFFELPTHNFWPFIPLYEANKTEPPKIPKKPWPPSVNRYNYGEVLYKSILFFEVQRSGWLPDNRKVKWRGHSALEDQGDNGEDLSGGWYDSGDYIKFGLPMASASSMLLWGLVEYPDAYRSSGILEDMRDCVRWPLDYFIKAHPEKYVFYGQVGDPYIDHTYWGRPEDMDMDRPAFKLTPDLPGSDVIAETAASMAAGYLVFVDVDPPYAKRLLQHAQELFEFAENYRGPYSNSIESAAEFYASSNDEDELAWAAAWLYRATDNRHYLRRAEHWYGRAPDCWAQSWADKSCGLPVLLYKLTKDRKYKHDIEKIFYDWLPGGSIHYTPKGLAYKDDWGTLRYTANMAFISLVAADLNVESKSYRQWAKRQIHYMLGDGGRSYVIGYGHDPPTRPHHASSSCRPPPYDCSWSDYTKTGPNAHTLYGALVGGPGRNDEYEDERDDYIHNEVGCDYNGGFQSAVAALKHVELQLS